MRAIARSISAKNRAAARGLRSRYQSCAAADSATASGWNDTRIVKLLGDLLPSFAPRHHADLVAVDLGEPLLDLQFPTGGSIRVDLVVQTLQQRPGQRGAGVWRQFHCFLE